jgi:DNA-nicking Smr family endonuclease
MTRDDKLAPEDVDLFRESVGEVRPLKDSGRAALEPDKPPPAPLQREKDERQVLHELLHFPVDPGEMETGEELAYLRPGLQRRYLTRLKRGHYSLAAHLDLHQMNAEAARSAILEFIEHARQRGYGCVRIVHGKGLRSRKGPVLKWLTRRILARHPAVAAFASCRPVDGGTGAVAVLLRGSRRG